MNDRIALLPRGERNCDEGKETEECPMIYLDKS